MNIGAICEVVKDLKDDEYDFIADECVKDGYGQTCGGYLSLKNVEPTHITQKDHFLSYYDNLGRKDNKPTFQYLRCPQLLLFIAEIAGMPTIKEAYNMLKEYEKYNGLYQTDKSGNYLWGRKDKFLSKFKEKLGIYSLVKIINKANNWDEVKKETEKI
ncbi:MAG: hypothetical protein IKL46_00080 [Clostridia bacterium]|nr:hypothetical protein [Clostridia bacterium]